MNTMKKILYSLTWIITFQVILSACIEDDPQLGAPPTAEDAGFTYTTSAESDNILLFKGTSSAFMKKWDFGNGTKAEGNEVTGIFPTKGTYVVTLTVYTSGGSISSFQTIEIEEDDPTLLDIPVYNMLTGGAGNPEGKTWIIDATRNGHFGVGPNPSSGQGDVPEWYAATANEKAGAGLYNDEFTFKLSGFGYIQETNGDVFLNTKYASDFPGSFSNAGDFTAPYTAPTGLSWSISETGGVQYLNISTGGFIGYYTGVTSYKIVSLTEQEMVLRFEDAKDPGLAWYQRLIDKNFTPPPPPPPATSTLPIDFQGAKPPFNGFGGSTYDVVDNPNSSGINTSSKVGQYIKGFDGNWAGIETTLSSPIDFSTKTLIQYKVYSPVVGKALFKIETTNGSAAPIEVFADVTQVNTWQLLTFDFSGAPSNTFNKFAMFLDFDNNAGGTFYFDDIEQASVSAALTEEALTGGSAKTWILKPAAGSFGVGPTKGSDVWYPNGQDLSSARPCLFNDEFIFKTGGVYEYDTKGDVFGEAYMGITPDGCTSDTNLGANATAWGSGIHSFTFTPATESTPAYITVTGTGAFIVLPKAYNGGEYSSGPPTANASVKYEVLDYVKNGSIETLTLTIDVSAGEAGGAFWTYVLTNK